MTAWGGQSRPPLLNLLGGGTWVTVQRLPFQSSGQSFRDLKEEGYNRNIQKVFLQYFSGVLFEWIASLLKLINIS